ncbi:MAG: hypothetical protein KBT44_04985 [Bacteroidales bacterium]|nr:hypothetical protein [Candidatus Equibacterium intestinale]
MTTDIKRLVVYVVVILIQIIAGNHINLGPLVYICLLPILIVNLPLDQEPYFSILISFGLGLAVDILSDGVLGLNAGAAALTSLVSKPLFYPIFQKNNYSKKYIPPIRESGILPHINYMSVMLLVFFVFYIAFDGFTKTAFVTSVLRLAVNVAVNLAMILILDFSFFNDKR